jgi:cytochrome c
MRNLYLAAATAALLAAPHLAMAQEVEGDPEAGQRVFNQCRACHQVGENARNLVGPVLNDLFGRESASVEDYNYSQAMQDYDVTWTHETFRTYIKDPRGEVPGTKMVFAGIKNDEQITDLIAYLEQFDDDSDDAAQ